MPEIKKKLSVRPAWSAVALCLFMFYIILDSSYHVYGSAKGLFEGGFLIATPMLLLFFIAAGIHYTFTETCLIVKLYGIPLKTFLWSDVGAVIYMHTWRENRDFPGVYNHGVVKGQAIMISLNACPPFHPEYYVRSGFTITHLFSSIFIQFPVYRKDEFIGFFRKQYPAMEIQPPDAWEHM